MPELPEIETIKRQLNTKIVGKVWQGKKIIKVRRRAKLLIIDLEDKTSLIFHLKLTGQLIYNGKPGKHTRQVFVFDDKSQLIFNDMRKFGWWKQVKDTREIENGFGPEPLEMQYEDFKKRLKQRLRTRIKPLLLDQKFIAEQANLVSDALAW